MARIHVEDYRFCPRCAGGLSRKVLRPGEVPRLYCPACGFVFYFDPKVVAVALIPLPEGVVLVRQVRGPRAGLWVLPGGFVDLGEPPERAVVREVTEETGLIVRVSSLFQVCSHAAGQAVLLAYLTEPVAGRLGAGWDEHEARCFALSAIPWKELAFATTQHLLQDYLAAQTADRPWGLKQACSGVDRRRPRA